MDAALQASLSITNPWSLLKLMSMELVMPSNHLILCCPLLLLPSIFSSIRVFSNESVLHIRLSKYWSFSFNISPYNEYSGLISFSIDWLDLREVKGLSGVFSNTAFLSFFFYFYFIFKLYNIVLVLPNIEMNPPQVYMCSPSWTLLPPHTIPLGCPSAPAPSIQYSASNLDWQLVSYMILYMFQSHSPKSSHPLPLPQSP